MSEWEIFIERNSAKLYDLCNSASNWATRERALHACKVYEDMEKYVVERACDKRGVGYVHMDDLTREEIVNYIYDFREKMDKEGSSS